MLPNKDGICATRKAHVSLVARQVRVLERSCFRSPAGSERAREHAFPRLGLADPAPGDEFPEMEYEEGPDFSEICAETLSADAWRLVDHGHFVRDEDILLLEARSALRAACA